MAAVKRLLKDMETRTLVWLARSRMSSVVIVGTLAAAGLGVTTLSAQPSTAVRQKEPVVSSSVQPMSAYGCYNDPDGDGHIFCDGSVPISQLPASYGQCWGRSYYEAGSPIICRGTGW
jgi:hypothetical protein